jgi:hypothetical protein
VGDDFSPEACCGAFFSFEFKRAASVVLPSPLEEIPPLLLCGCSEVLLLLAKPAMVPFDRSLLPLAGFPIIREDDCLVPPVVGCAFATIMATCTLRVLLACGMVGGEERAGPSNVYVRKCILSTFIELDDGQTFNGKKQAVTMTCYILYTSM